MTTKSKGESVRQKLTAHSKKMGVDYKDLETVFMIERLVASLIADKKLASHLVFKGGFVGLKIYESPRHTVDLDALLVKAKLEKGWASAITSIPNAPKFKSAFETMASLASKIER